MGTLIMLIILLGFSEIDQRRLVRARWHALGHLVAGYAAWRSDGEFGYLTLAPGWMQPAMGAFAKGS